MTGALRADMPHPYLRFTRTEIRSLAAMTVNQTRSPGQPFLDLTQVIHTSPKTSPNISICHLPYHLHSSPIDLRKDLW